MHCTLDIHGTRTIQNPTENDIRQAVYSLDTQQGDAFLILALSETTYMQTGGDHKVGFDLEYQEADTKHHYRATRTLESYEIVKALVFYSLGSDDWKSMAEWEPITW